MNGLKGLKGLKGFALLTLVAFLALSSTPARADDYGSSPDAPLTFADSLTTSTLSIGSSAYSVVDLTAQAKIGTSQYSTITIGVSVIDDDTTGTTSRVRFGFVSTLPGSNVLNAATPETTGLVLTEGRTIYIKPTARWLIISGANGTSLVQVTRVR